MDNRISHLADAKVSVTKQLEYDFCRVFRADLPKISLLIALYKEENIVPNLLNNLKKLEYPREKLQVFFLIEADDKATLQAVQAYNDIPWLQIFIIPIAAPRTKPKALNIGLYAATGDIVGVYDAEDQPESSQLLKVAEKFQCCPDNVACLQARLCYYNWDENWMSRCFTIEYTAWFGCILRSFQYMGFLMPLGGSSAFVKMDALREVGGWDPFNVTEDADLAVRLFRNGYVCNLLDSTTYEEANIHFFPWIKQRSRWLKGYLQTWIVHTRHPVQCYREIGIKGILSLQIIFLLSTFSYICIPIFWYIFFYNIFSLTTLYEEYFWESLSQFAMSVFLFGQLIMLLISVYVLLKFRLARLILWVPVLPLYWLMGVIAVTKALFELLFKPYYWDKTRHGVSTYFSDQKKAGHVNNNANSNRKL
jgi:cellulose synthase/poly-beta-1,6-N-acetylglucosamine synthase-like glycosyltransferase